MNKSHTTIFVVLSAAYIGSTLLGPFPFSWLVKILPLTFLITNSVRSVSCNKHKFLIAGLVFSCFGDIFLDVDRTQLFVFGLGSFLIAHIFYMISFMPLRKITKNMIAIMTGYITYALVMFYFILPDLNNLFVPVLVYMSVLMLMGITTLLSKNSNIWLVLGGASFIVSDSLIGLDKFHSPITNAGVLIMISYYFAQFSLVKGMFFVTRDST